MGSFPHGGDFGDDLLRRQRLSRVAPKAGRRGLHVPHGFRDYALKLSDLRLRRD